MRPATAKSKSGSALVTALIMLAVLAIVVTSYLALLTSRNRNTLRSLAWNSALPLLEAGIEEALTHLYDDASLTNNGWAAVASGSNIIYQKTRYFTNGASDVSHFTVTISNAATLPVIYSQGFVSPPLGGGSISRTVQIVTTNPATFTGAIAATGAVLLSSSTAYVDSFNSADPNYSTNGLYNSSLRETHGRVVTDSSANPAITTGPAHIYGSVDTGPTGTVSGNVGAIGSSGVDSTYVSHDLNVSFPDQVAPAGYLGWTAPVSGSYNYGGTNYNYNLTTGNYTLAAALNMNGHTFMAVTGNVTLVVTGNITINSGSYIYIAPGASLTLIEAGSTAVLAGGGVVNGTGLAQNFSYLGLPANTSVSYSGNSAFIGTINAPEAAFSITGNSDFSGAIIAKTFSDTGGAAIHFDEGLGAKGALTMSSYTEL